LTLSSAAVGCPETPSSGLTYDYMLYGLRLRSRLKLTLDEAAGEGDADLEILPAEPDWFESTVSQVELDRSDWIHIHEIAGGWSYVRYDENFDFLISSSGDRIFYRLLAKVSLESFQTYALGRIFSFALVKKGYEPLHAATVIVNQRAVAFMGAAGFGKSTLAACFVAAGHPLLSDDVLRLEEQGDRYVAFPGPPRLKLFPRVARRYLGDVSAGIPINNMSLHPKCVFSLPAAQACAAPMPLGAVYVVTSPRKVYRKQPIAVSSLPPVEALLKVVRFTHNRELNSRNRLARQLDAARGLIERVPIRSLSHPRILSSLSDVRFAILGDLKNYVDPV
jgi:hypothetical protein